MRSARASRGMRQMALTVVAIAGCLAALGAGEARAANDRRVLVAVYEAGTDRQAFALESGQAFEIQAGASVRLEIVDPAWDSPGQRNRARVGGSFATSEPRVLKLSGEKPGEGSVWAKAMAVPASGKAVRLSFDAPGRQRGEIFVQVVAAAVTPAPAPPPSDRVQAIVAALYHGILLRDPDPSAQTWIDTIRREGFAGVLRAAHEVASSRESKIDLYGRADVSNQQRLVALYRNLLGIEASSVDGGLWQSQLAQLNAGDIAGIVDWMVRRPEFFQAQGFGRPRY